MTANMTPREWHVRYVSHYRIMEYLRLGWMVANDLGGTVHGEFSVLMSWPCSCKVVEPR
jgi:hypothetical protein